MERSTTSEKDNDNDNVYTKEMLYIGFGGGNQTRTTVLYCTLLELSTYTVVKSSKHENNSVYIPS